MSYDYNIKVGKLLFNVYYVIMVSLNRVLNNINLILFDTIKTNFFQRFYIFFVRIVTLYCVDENQHSYNL